MARWALDQIKSWKRTIFLLELLVLEVGAFGLTAADVAPSPKPVPLMQAIPLARDEVSLQRDGREIARYVFGHELNRPFVFPVIGPSGRSLATGSRARTSRSSGRR